KDSYKLYGLFEDEHLVGLIGFKPMITLYYGRFVWVCDLVTDRDRRSEGLGEQLLQFVEDWTVHHGYKIIALSSGIQRVDTHRFYNDKMNYSKVSYVFKKHMDVE